MFQKETAPAKILLVYPEAPQDSYWSFSHSLKLIDKKAAMPPLGLLTVAAMLPENEFALRLVDMNVQPLNDADIEWADAVFFSAMIVQRKSLEESIARARALGKTVVAGGPYTSTAYRETKNVDCFLIGEAEAVWDEFLADLRNGELRPAYAAPVRDNEYQAITEFFGPNAHVVRAERHPDINLAPVPRFDLIRLDDYAVMTVQASRGCPVGCEFCDIWRRFGRKARNKSPERIRAELDVLHRQGWRDSVFLVDDNFIGNRARAKEILQELAAWQKERNWPFSFLTEATLSLADDDELLDLMSQVGFTSVFVGIETPCTESLKETRKIINTLGSMAEKVAKIQRAGIQLMSGFIIGFDSDPENVADKMTACIQEMGIPQAMIGILNALPDTDLYDRLEADGRIRFETTGNNTHGFAINFQPKRPESAVLADYKRVLEAAYPRDMKSFFERSAVLRARWPKHARVSAGKLPLGWKLRAVANCLVAAAKSPYRYHAYRFLLGTLLKKPTYFEQAATLIIKAHHLWAITGQAFEAEEMRENMHVRLCDFTDFLKNRRAALGEAVSTIRQAIPDLKIASDATVQDILGRITSSFSGLGDVKDLQSCQAGIAATLREIEAYSKRIQKDTEKEFRRLSRETRKMLASELERFRSEANVLTSGFSLQESLIPVPQEARR